MKNNGLKNAKAITLIAMVVTIIVLLILAGVSIAVLTGENGILNRATSAKQTHEEKTAEEELRLGISALTIDYRKNTTNPQTFKEFVVSNEGLIELKKAMGLAANNTELVVEDAENGIVSYKGQKYQVDTYGAVAKYIEPQPGKFYTKNGVAYYYTGSNPTEEIPITSNYNDIGYYGKYLGIKVNYTPIGSPKTLPYTTYDSIKGEVVVVNKTIGTGKNGNETTPTYRIFYIDVNGTYGEAGTIYLKADDDDNYAGVSSLENATGTTKMEQFNKQWWADTTNCNNNNKLSSASYGNVRNTYKLLDPNQWTEYKDAIGTNQIADYVVGAPSLEMWIDSYNAFLTVNPVNGYYLCNCTVTPSSNGTAATNDGAGYFVGNNDTYINNGYYTESFSLINPSNYSNNAIAADRVETWNKGSGVYWLASPAPRGGYGSYYEVVYVDGRYNRLHGESAMGGAAFCPLVSCRAEVAIQEIL